MISQIVALLTAVSRPAVCFWLKIGVHVLCMTHWSFITFDADVKHWLGQELPIGAIEAGIVISKDETFSKRKEVKQ